MSVGFQHAEQRDANALRTPSETGSTCDTDSCGRLNRANPRENQLPVRVFDAQPSLTSTSSHTVHTPDSDGVLLRDLETAERSWSIFRRALTNAQGFILRAIREWALKVGLVFFPPKQPWLNGNNESSTRQLQNEFFSDNRVVCLELNRPGFNGDAVYVILANSCGRLAPA